MSDIVETPPKFISRRQVLDRVGVSFATVWTWMKDGKFPRGRELGGRTMWIESEVTGWMESRPVKKLKGDDPE
jgi:predicted DNA-binding transcriptional regulator AlpA